MNTLNFNLQNCYGINNFDHKFEFTRKNKCFVIYAPNGTMKTSFAKTMDDLKEGIPPRDLIFKDSRDSFRHILKSDGSELTSDDVFIIHSYKDSFQPSKLSNLLVSPNLKKQYDNILKEIETKKINLIKELKKLSGIKKDIDIEGELAFAFNKKPREFFETLDYIGTKELLSDGYSLPIIPYATLINDDVKKFTENSDVKRMLRDYIEKYNELLQKSELFKKGFNHTNATTVSKSLSDNGFFKVKYGVVIGNSTINSKKELDAMIKNSKDKILNNTDLSTKFENIDKLIKNVKLRDLRDFLENNPELIVELENFNELRRKLWLTYLKACNESFKSLLDVYIKSKSELKKIINLAKEEETKWNEVVNIFNSRFNVPFKVEIENKEDVILKETTATITFKYEYIQEEAVINKDELLSVLSTGERRALYILNIIFEIETLKLNDKDILLIIDDIADSFDYKNKYAIIEYLKEIKETPIFNSLILTHNFDFYRTVAKRLNASRLMAVKKEDSICLKDWKYSTKDVFNTWKNELETDNRKLIASIPFVRNICEYLEEKNSDNYIFLTSLLHIKENTRDIRVGDLEKVYNEVWRVRKNLNDKDRSVLIIIYEEASNILNDTIDEISLENKIVMSIAIRLKSEDYMINRIDDDEFVNNIKGVQTGKLLNKFKKLFPSEIEVIRLLDQVCLMTPENIHINSFMYEPLLDMSDLHLKKLYINIDKLSESYTSSDSLSV